MSGRRLVDTLLDEIADGLEQHARNLETETKRRRELMTESPARPIDDFPVEVDPTKVRDPRALSPEELRERRDRLAAEISKRDDQLLRLVEQRMDAREKNVLMKEIGLQAGHVGSAEDLRNRLQYAVAGLRDMLGRVESRLAADDRRQRRADVAAARLRLGSEAGEISQEMQRLETLRGALAFDVVALGQTDREDELATVEADLDALTLRSERFSAALAELDAKEADRG